MSRPTLILKSLLLLLLAFLAYLKVTHPNPDWVFEILTDLAIVLIVLGTAEILVSFFYAWLLSLSLNLEKLKIKKL